MIIWLGFIITTIIASKKQMSVCIEIIFKEEVSDHSGYCSGGECELTARVYKKQVDVEIGEITNNLEYFEKYADEVVCDHSSNSNYCDLSEDVVSAGLAAHENRITILRVSLVDTSKKRKYRRLKRDKRRLKKEQQRRAACWSELGLRKPDKAEEEEEEEEAKAEEEH